MTFMVYICGMKKRKCKHEWMRIDRPDRGEVEVNRCKKCGMTIGGIDLFPKYSGGRIKDEYMADVEKMLFQSFHDQQAKVERRLFDHAKEYLRSNEGFDTSKLFDRLNKKPVMKRFRLLQDYRTPDVILLKGSTIDRNEYGYEPTGTFRKTGLTLMHETVENNKDWFEQVNEPDIYNQVVSETRINPFGLESQANGLREKYFIARKSELQESVIKGKMPIQIVIMNIPSDCVMMSHEVYPGHIFVTVVKK